MRPGRIADCVLARRYEHNAIVVSNIFVTNIVHHFLHLTQILSFCSKKRSQHANFVSAHSRNYRNDH